MDLAFLSGEAENSKCDGAKHSTSYQTLVRANKRILGHPIIQTYTHIKWDLFAKKWYWLQMLAMFLFNLFWTCRYVETMDLAQGKYWILSVLMIIVGYILLIVHTVFSLVMAKREFALTFELDGAVGQAREQEERLKHRRTSDYTSQMKSDKYYRLLGNWKRQLGMQAVIPTLLVDLTLFLYTSAKLFVFVTKAEKS